LPEARPRAVQPPQRVHLVTSAATWLTEARCGRRLELLQNRVMKLFPIVEVIQIDGVFRRAGIIRPQR
jgi:hypothetical protein